MHKFRRDVAKGLQDEPPFVKPRVRDLQRSFAQNALIIKQDIQVQNPGAEPILSRPTPNGMLNLLKPCKKSFWFKIGTNPGYTIHKPILALQINRFGLIQGGLGIHQATFALVDRCDSLPTIVGLMPDIRSDPYVGRMSIIQSLLSVPLLHGFARGQPSEPSGHTLHQPPQIRFLV